MNTSTESNTICKHECPDQSSSEATDGNRSNNSNSCNNHENGDNKPPLSPYLDIKAPHAHPAGLFECTGKDWCENALLLCEHELRIWPAYAQAHKELSKALCRTLDVNGVKGMMPFDILPSQSSLEQLCLVFLLQHFSLSLCSAHVLLCVLPSFLHRSLRLSSILSLSSFAL